MPEGIATKGASKGKPEKAKVDRKTESIFLRLSRFIRESYVEVVKKAVWPTWPELKKFTTIVIIAVLIVGVWIGGLDFILTQISRRIGLGPR